MPLNDAKTRHKGGKNLSITRCQTSSNILAGFADIWYCNVEHIDENSRLELLVVILRRAGPPRRRAFGASTRVMHILQAEDRSLDPLHSCL